MLKVLYSCIREQHDLGLVILAACVCVFGCFTAVNLLVPAREAAGKRRLALVSTAAGVFGASVWTTHFIAEPTRTRKLLLNLSELEQLAHAVERDGYTLVPLEMYWKAGRAKLRIGVAKGKKQHDKRATEKDRDWQRDKARILRTR